MTIQQKMAYNIQLTNEECREMVEKILKTMTHIVLQHGSEIIDSKMVKVEWCEKLTYWAFDVKSIVMLEDNLAKIDKYIMSDENKEVLKTYGIKRTYNCLYSELCEYILSALEFGRKEPNKKSKNKDVHIYGIPYDVKMVDWKGADTNYVCFRDYGQRKFWIAVDKKSSLANRDRVASLIKYLKAYVIENKELIESGSLRTIKIEGDKY